MVLKNAFGSQGRSDSARTAYRWDRIAQTGGAETGKRPKAEDQKGKNV
ncbi:MAG: hypothetical protein LBG90_02805 [Spirochaetaceae bacterium]|nr:hypothetical protein [Spirochaetaceae bacterium]